MLTSQTKTFVGQVLLAGWSIMCEVMYLQWQKGREVFVHFPEQLLCPSVSSFQICPNSGQPASLIWLWYDSGNFNLISQFVLTTRFLKEICSRIPKLGKVQRQMKPHKLCRDSTNDYLGYEYARLLEWLPWDPCAEDLKFLLHKLHRTKQNQQCGHETQPTHILQCLIVFFSVPSWNILATHFRCSIPHTGTPVSRGTIPLLP